ncbi:hypothetical protein H5410_060881 [Solanum commersonii]|uniref:Uncharacterized protein n=1 Tax=Solanum commersonii TaxID=4109 RepID=A0A9J5W677_SOLCO|nr:hypothetical protein H5410_060881 [Solanum commersonii]
MAQSCKALYRKSNQRGGILPVHCEHRQGGGVDGFREAEVLIKVVAPSNVMVQLILLCQQLRLGSQPEDLMHRKARLSLEQESEASASSNLVYAKHRCQCRKARLSLEQESEAFVSSNLVYAKQREAFYVPVTEHDNIIEQHAGVRGPAQPHVLLARLDIAPTFGNNLGTTGSPITVGATPPIQGPSLGFQTHGSALVPSLALLRFATPMVFASATMSIAEQKSFERFVRLALPRFDDTTKRRLMTLTYVARFHEFFRYAMSSIPTKFERICKLKAITSLMLSGGTFQTIIDYARMIEKVEIIQVIAHRVILGRPIPDAIHVQMVLVDLGLFRSIRIHIMGPQGFGAFGCFVCEEFGHKAKHFPRRISFTVQPGSHATRSTPTTIVCGTSQSARGGTKGGA